MYLDSYNMGSEYSSRCTGLKFWPQGLTSFMRFVLG